MAARETPSRRRIGIQLVGLARRWRQALDARLSRAGLSDATWAPLMHLHEHGSELSQTQLAARLGLDGSSLVRLLDILAQRGLIERQPHPADRRIKLLRLTPEGLHVVAELRERLGAIEDELLADVDEGQASDLLDTFARIDARIAAAAEPPAQEPA